MNFNLFKSGGNIKIKKENRGKFTDYCSGKVTQNCIDKAKKSNNSTLKKRAIFAENARKWRLGGIINSELKKYDSGGQFSKYFVDFKASKIPSKKSVFLDENEDNNYYIKNPFSAVAKVELPSIIKKDSEDEIPIETTPFKKKYTFIDYNIPEEEEELVPSEDNLKSTELPLNASLSDRINYVYDYFINKGLSPELAAGFVGNFLGESELNYQAINENEKRKGLKGYGVGIALWSDKRKEDFLKLIGTDIEKSNLLQLLDFAWWEALLRKTFMDELKKATTVEQATDLVLRGFENGSNDALMSILDFTNTYYNNPLNRLDYKTALLKKAKRALDSLRIYQNRKKANV